MDSIFLQISLLLIITVSIAFITKILRQPLIIAYIIAGIICGPLLFNFINQDHDLYATFSKFGIVLLLFIIGLNLNFHHLKSIGKSSLVTGLGQVLFTASIGTVILIALKVSLTSAIYLAIAITFSSTIIIMKLLSDKHDTETVYGKHTIGLMLVQDVIAVLLLIGLGIIGNKTAGIGSELLWISLKLILSLGALYLISQKILPKLLDKISSSSELLFLFTLAWCFGAASLLHVIGLSMEIGAIISGIALSSSPYQTEIASRVKPLRDFFLIIFFIVLGSEMSLGSINPASVLLPAGILSLFILIGNPLILYFLFRNLKFTRRNSFLAGLTAAQVSEFGFILLYSGRNLGHLSGKEVPIFTAVAITTIFFSSYLITYNEKLYRLLLPFFKFFGPDKARQKEKVKESFNTWIVGYHRIGTRIAEVMKKLKKKYSVIDFDPNAIARLRKDNTPFVFGDIADIELLESLPLASSKLIIMTIPAVDDQLNLINHLKKARSQAITIANAYQKEDAKRLYTGGADFVMMPHYVGGEWISNLLSNPKWNKKTLTKLKNEQNLILSNNSSS